MNRIMATPSREISNILSVPPRLSASAAKFGGEPCLFFAAEARRFFALLFQQVVQHLSNRVTCHQQYVAAKAIEPFANRIK